MAEQTQKEKDLLNVQRGVAIGSFASSNLTQLMVGVTKGQEIGKQGDEAVRAIESIGISNMTQVKDATKNIEIINENLSDMLSESANNARMAQGRLAVTQAETMLGGTSKQEAKDDITQITAKDDASLKRRAKQDRVAITKRALALSDQALEDIASVKSQMITEKEAIAQGVVTGLNDLANTASMATRQAGV